MNGRKNSFNKKNNKLISSLRLINLWEEFLNVRNKKIPDKIVSNVKNLWKLFNIERNDLPKDYMNNHDFITGYMAAFFLPNIQRIYNVLSINAVNEHLKNIIKDKKKLKICDIGSGPLSATFGILFFIGDFFYKDITDENQNININFEIVTVEKSENIVEIGKNLLMQLIDPSKIKLKNIKNLSLVDGQFDIVISANILNEIPNNIQNSYLKKIYELTINDGLYISIEPGQDRYAKRLSSVRDNTISKFEDFEIISPCPHKKNCPLSSKSQKKDWCWFQINWELPEIQREIDRLCGIEHNTLNFSYVVYAKNISKDINIYTDNSLSNFSGISVSDPIFITPEKKGYNSTLKWINTNKITGDLKIKYGGKYKKNIICSNDGNLYSIITILSDKNDRKNSINRGTIVKTIPANSLLCKENW